MVARVLVYLFQLLVYTLLVWLGFYSAGQQLPGPIEAPWLWALVALAPLIPWQWGDYGDGSSLWFDGDYGD